MQFTPKNQHIEHRESPLDTFMFKLLLAILALRSTVAAFYEVDLAFGFNPLDVVGVLFPVVLLLYWGIRGGRIYNLGLAMLFIALLIWTLLSIVLVSSKTGAFSVQKLSSFFRFLNGFAAFMVFPFIINSKEKLEKLLLAFLIASLFPLAQALMQLAGFDLFGLLESSASRYGEDDIGYTVYYGLYHKNEGYIMAALFGSLALVYKIGSRINVPNPDIKKYYIWLIGLLIMAMMTVGRTFMVSMLIVMLALVFIHMRRPIYLLIMIFGLVGFLATPYFSSKVEELVSRSDEELNVLTGDLKSDVAFNGRMGMWRRVYAQFAKRDLSEQLLGTELSIAGHNDYLSWLFERGYVGFALYLAIILGLLFTTFFKLIGFSRHAPPFLHYYGIMVVCALFTWAVTAITFNPSYYPDYNYFVIGNAAIFLAFPNASDARISSAPIAQNSAPKQPVEKKYLMI